MGRSHMTLLVEKPASQMLVQSPSHFAHVPPPSIRWKLQAEPRITMMRNKLPSDAEPKGFLLFGILL